ncbi:MAG: DUF2191 domain-containing protein [Bacteroidota bacterium]
MKITANIPDDIINDIQEYTGGKNLTESIVMVLADWLYGKRIAILNERIAKNPIDFHEEMSESIRTPATRTPATRTQTIIE